MWEAQRRSSLHLRRLPEHTTPKQVNRLSEALSQSDLTTGTLVMRLLVAMLISGAVGIERELSNQPAGCFRHKVPGRRSHTPVWRGRTRPHNSRAPSVSVSAVHRLAEEMNLQVEATELKHAISTGTSLLRITVYLPKEFDYDQLNRKLAGLEHGEAITLEEKG